MELFFFKEAYIRTSTEEYSTNNIANYFIHLTNNAIQKNAANYGQYESGNQLSFKSLSKYMPEEKADEIWAKIKEITYMVFSSVKKKINFYQRKNCFELFGLDYFISYDQKVWLIEVNENPCIECSSTLLSKLIPRMLNDAFKLTVDQIIDKKPTEDKVYPVDGYEDHESMWESLGELTANAEYTPSPNKKLQKMTASDITGQTSTP